MRGLQNEHRLELPINRESNSNLYISISLWLSKKGLATIANDKERSSWMDRQSICAKSV